MLDLLHPLDWHKLSDTKQFPVMEQGKALRNRYTDEVLDFEYEQVKVITERDYSSHEFLGQYVVRTVYSGVKFLTFPVKLKPCGITSLFHSYVLSSDPRSWTQRYAKLEITRSNDSSSEQPPAPDRYELFCEPAPASGRYYRYHHLDRERLLRPMTYYDRRNHSWEQLVVIALEHNIDPWETMEVSLKWGCCGSKCGTASPERLRNHILDSIHTHPDRVLIEKIIYNE